MLWNRNNLSAKQFWCGVNNTPKYVKAESLVCVCYHQNLIIISPDTTQTSSSRQDINKNIPHGAVVTQKIGLTLGMPMFQFSASEVVPAAPGLSCRLSFRLASPLELRSCGEQRKVWKGWKLSFSSCLLLSVSLILPFYIN